MPKCKTCHSNDQRYSFSFQNVAQFSLWMGRSCVSSDCLRNYNHPWNLCYIYMYYSFICQFVPGNLYMLFSLFCFHCCLTTCIYGMCFSHILVCFSLLVDRNFWQNGSKLNWPLGNNKKRMLHSCVLIWSIFFFNSFWGKITSNG